MKIKYIFVYVDIFGCFGNSEITLKFNERIKSIDDIRKIEEKLSKKLDRGITYINHKRIQILWK